MNHRSVIKFLVVPVILVTMGYSIWNVSEFAWKFHPGPAVFLLGGSVGTANALAVYAWVIAKTDKARNWAIAGTIVFGALSAILQVALYRGNDTAWLVALALGCFGPVAEGLLAGLHAALSEEQAKLDKEAEERQRKRNDAMQRKPDATQLTQVTQALAQVNAIPQPALTDRERALQLHKDGHAKAEIARMLSRPYSTVDTWIQRNGFAAKEGA